MSYSSMEQRMASGNLDLFPDFIPADGAQASVGEQEEFYRLMKRLYELAFAEPELFVPTLHEDDPFPNRFNKTSYAKPELQASLRKFKKAVDGVLEVLFLLGKGEEVKLTKRQKAGLERLGVGLPAGVTAGWKWMSTRPGASLPSFSHCLFRTDFPYSAALYAWLLGEGPFRRLESWMVGRGYRWYDHTKKCDGCRYCVQTDKTGSRPLAAIPVEYGRETVRLCPYFPGYSYCWTSLTDELVDRMIAMLAFMDSFLP